MLPGPVFNFELMATARRGRFYLIRAFYAAVLFVILWAVHSTWTSETGGELTSRMVSWFAISTFCAITIGQEILVLVLTPALVAGVIADEKQRKTLHYLMASRLSSAEIVLGKLLVRMLYVTVLLGVSLPVLSLLVLMGGVDPWLVLLSCGATLSTGWFLASLSIWVSTIARRVREAFFIAFGLECLWLFAPFLLRTISIPAWSLFDQTTQWLAEWVGASSPIDVGQKLIYSIAISGGMTGSKTQIELVAWMMGLQLAAGLVLSLAASCQLRPIFRRQGSEGGVGVKPFLSFRRKRRAGREATDMPGYPLVCEPRSAPSTPRRWRLWHRPTLGDRPMLWKELYTGRPGGLARLVGLLLTAIGGGLLAYNTHWMATLAIREIWDFGNAPRTDYTAWAHRTAFMWFLHAVEPLIYIIGILGVAGAAAASFTSEHEEDTWVSLTATDLTGREIVFAKMIGAMKRGRVFGGVVVFLAALGAALGSISPLSIPLLILGMGVYAWAAAALGLWISLQLRATWRAQFLTMACLLLINVFGQGMLNMLSKFGWAPQLWPGFTPYEISKLLIHPEFIEHLANTNWPGQWSVQSIDDGPTWQTIFSVASMLAYSAFAALLIWHTLHRFEIVAGRARRSTALPPSPHKLPDQQNSTRTTDQRAPADIIA
jgi:ABC-type transport system involved in multi-copper enzyme maturation permease subunit